MGDKAKGICIDTAAIKSAFFIWYVRVVNG